MADTRSKLGKFQLYYEKNTTKRKYEPSKNLAKKNGLDVINSGRHSDIRRLSIFQWKKPNKLTIYFNRWFRKLIRDKG